MACLFAANGIEDAALWIVHVLCLVWSDHRFRILFVKTIAMSDQYDALQRERRERVSARSTVETSGFRESRKAIEKRNFRRERARSE